MPRRITRRSTTDTPMFTPPSSFPSFRIMLLPTHTTSQQMLLQLQLFWVSCTVAALKEVRLWVTQGCREGLYLGG